MEAAGGARGKPEAARLAAQRTGPGEDLSVSDPCAASRLRFIFLPD